MLTCRRAQRPSCAHRYVQDARSLLRSLGGSGSELSQLGGYPFEVRYSDGSLVPARAAADVAANAYIYFSRLFPAVQPDIAVIVASITIVGYSWRRSL
jgi:hypothetical protein